MKACIGIYGKSNSGKTTLIENIIKNLSKEGLKIVTIKITDKEIEMDLEAKDTWRYKKAGSELVVFSSKNETDFLHFKKTNTNDILGYIEKFGKFDLVIIEGARDENIPKIKLGDIAERKNTLTTYDRDFNKIIKLIKKIIVQR